MVKAATQSTLNGYEITLKWLCNNGLTTNLTKTKLITFTKLHALNCIRGKIWGGHYTNSSIGPNKIIALTSLWYLGVFITADLKWEKHMDIIVNCAWSTISGISILGNSV